MKSLRDRIFDKDHVHHRRKVNEVAHNIKNKTINSNTSSSVSLNKKVNSKILNIITILDFEMKETETYKIIDSPKSNLEKNEISKESELAKAAVLCKKGDTFNRYSINNTCK